ncbi:hypothetical protein BKA70DRAFT_1535830 [Coprinopsis sp. MPI-PUGE-AT-0042]|nr:hypothetical protein BKA70DRAFT_1535830 [Coprinopsis sp. MPI-PUGE-AT-0042]
MHKPRPKSINHPAGLDPYFFTNNILLHSGLPALDGYLSQLNDNIKTLEDEITKLQAIPDAKEELGWFHHERTVCKSIKHPIRSVPLEVLGQIFAFALDSPSSNRLDDVGWLDRRPNHHSWYRSVVLSSNAHSPGFLRAFCFLPAYTSISLASCDYVMDTQDEEEEDFDYDLCTAIPVQWSNLEAIHCGRHTIGLWWISNNAPGDDIHPLKIYLPQGYGPLSAARRRRGMLHGYGLEVEIVSKHEHKEKLRSMTPQFSKYSQTWWRF